MALRLWARDNNLLPWPVRGQRSAHRLFFRRRFALKLLGWIVERGFGLNLCGANARLQIKKRALLRAQVLPLGAILFDLQQSDLLAQQRYALFAPADGDHGLGQLRLALNELQIGFG